MVTTAISLPEVLLHRASPTDAWRHIREQYPSLAALSLRELIRTMPREATYPTSYVMVVTRDVWAIWSSSPAEPASRGANCDLYDHRGGTTMKSNQA